MRRPKALLAVLLALGSPAGAAADTLRCEGGVVRDGDHQIDVLTRCGEPRLRSLRSTEVVTTNRIGLRVTRVVEIET